MFDKDKQLEARIKLSGEIMIFQEGKKDVVLELATGVGKNFNFLNICKSLNPQSILFVVPQDMHIDNFKEDVIKLGFGYLLDIIEIACYASLKKFVGRSFDVIGYDEAHSLYSDARMRYVQQITGKKRILLSATLEENVKEKLASAFQMDVFSCPYEEAVKRGILPPMEMEVYSIYLDDVEKKYPHKYKGSTKEVLLTATQYYQMLDNKLKNAVEKYKNREEFKGDPQWLFNRMLRAGGEIQTWLGEYKTDLLKQVMEEEKGKRMIIFTASKAQAHLVGGAKAVSSDNSRTENKKIIEDFNKGLTDEIYARSMLVEGQNLHNTPLGIVVGLGNKELRATQVRGRCLRHPQPRMIILVVAGTRDEKYLENSFKINIYGERL